MIDQFGRKMCQKKREDVNYKFLLEFFQKYFFVHERSAVKNSFSKYVCYPPDVLFWTVLYIQELMTLLMTFQVFRKLVEIAHVVAYWT